MVYTYLNRELMQPTFLWLTQACKSVFPVGLYAGMENKKNMYTQY